MKKIVIGTETTKKPELSVVIPTYNRKELLKRAINSVLKQKKVGLIEILIIDDSNLPLTKKYLCEFEQPNVIIIYYKNEKRMGAPISRNFGIRNSRADFIAFLDDDDEWLPDKSWKQIKALKGDPNAALCICYSEDYRFNTKRISKPESIVHYEDLIKSFNLSSTLTYMVRKDNLELIKDMYGNYFDPNLKSAQEYDIAIRLTKILYPFKTTWYVITVPEVLAIQHESPGEQISYNWNNKIQGIKELYRKHNMPKLKTFGLITLFRIAKIPGVGHRIYRIIIPIKRLYER